MPTPRQRPLDALGLAKSGTVVEREFPVEGFARLGDRLAEHTGSVRARAGFHMAGLWPAAQLTVDADVVLTCQRCLGPLKRKLESSSQLVFADEGTAQLPEGHEAVGGDPHHLDLEALVEDELLLSLPLIPHHEAGETCVSSGPDGARAAPEAARMRRPFAGLKDLLKH